MYKVAEDLAAEVVAQVAALVDQVAQVAQADLLDQADQVAQADPLDQAGQEDLLDLVLDQAGQVDLLDQAGQADLLDLQAPWAQVKWAQVKWAHVRSWIIQKVSTLHKCSDHLIVQLSDPYFGYADFIHDPEHATYPPKEELPPTKTAPEWPKYPPKEELPPIKGKPGDGLIEPKAFHGLRAYADGI